MLTMLGGIYQFERTMMLERERLAIAKQKGKPINIELSQNICALAEEGINKMQITK